MKFQLSIYGISRIYKSKILHDPGAWEIPGSILHVKLVVILDTGHHLTSHSTEMQIENTYMYTYKNNINDNVYRQYVKKINLSYFIAEITFLQKL